MAEDPRDLPDNLKLPLASGEPWWYFIGGRPSVDFTNTLRERWGRQVETLVTSKDLGRWLLRAKLTDVALTPSPAPLEAARELREAINGAFTRAIASEAPDAGEIAVINRWLPSAQQPLKLVTARAGLVLREDETRGATDHALGLLALDAADILGDAKRRPRLRICASETCSARFFDNSPAGRRQWCSMSACGNVAKARRYRARHASPLTIRRSDAKQR